MVDSIKPTGGGDQKNLGSDLLTAGAVAVPAGFITYFVFPQKVTAKKLLGLTDDVFEKKFIKNENLSSKSNTIDQLGNQRGWFKNIETNTGLNVSRILNGKAEISVDDYLASEFEPLEGQQPTLANLEQSIKDQEAFINEQQTKLTAEEQRISTLVDGPEKIDAESHLSSNKHNLRMNEDTLRNHQNMYEIAKSKDANGMIQQEVLESIVKKHKTAKISGETEFLIKDLGENAPKFGSLKTAAIVAGATAFAVYLATKIFRKPKKEAA